MYFKPQFSDMTIQRNYPGSFKHFGCLVPPRVSDLAGLHAARELGCFRQGIEPRPTASCPPGRGVFSVTINEILSAYFEF